MEIFVSEKFLDEFIVLEEDSFKNKDREKLSVYNKIYNLFNSGLFINSDISNDKIQTFFESNGNKKINNIKNVIALIAVKSGKCKFINMPLESIPDFSAFYFVEEPILYGKNSGVVIIDDLKSLDNFYSNCTINSLNIGEDNYSLIADAVPPCNAMLIIDKYLFKGSKKLENFLKYLHLYVKKDLDIPFQLTIISSYESNNMPLPTAVFEKYTIELNKFHNLQYQILLDSRISIDDRKFYTNYTKANWGHPLDRESIYNQNFIASSDNVLRDYSDYCDDINKWKIFCTRIPKTMGSITTMYSNISFENRIFENIKI
jgi:hypothetical protein